MSSSESFFASIRVSDSNPFFRIKLGERLMPYVKIRITKEGTTQEQKAD
ncbi:hypothetical protein [Leptospira stimsonii]|nr:hypothetical protein [Leptospira stimsonii]